MSYDPFGIARRWRIIKDIAIIVVVVVAALNGYCTSIVYS